MTFVLTDASRDICVTDELEILERLGREDWDGALTALMEAYGRPVYRQCLQMVRDTQLAEDALQDTFIRAHRALRTFRRGSSLRTWIHAIAHHRCLDALKAERRRQARIEATDDPPDSPDTAPGPESRVSERQLTAALARCLDRLLPHVKAAVLARYQQSMTFQEMSTVLGARPAALERQVARSLPVLRRCLEQTGVGL